MPKMGSDYLELKKSTILHAAYVVCMRKPMHTVSMRDIISECGFSQGNIYRYFANIDVILVELINQECVTYDIKTLTDEAITSGKTHESVICDIFGIWEKAILDNYIGAGKIYYELCSTYASDRARMKYLTKNTLFIENQNYMWDQLYHFLARKISKGCIKPKLHIDDIFNILATSINGITRDLIMYHYYQIAPAQYFGGPEKGRLVRGLCAAIILMLGDKEN
ncbi:MAG: TetR/AcrR family transcriptional regulator [Oscillospiraceae bacterium]|nr:TetR/AcrR family transcriptional regulator [Oscillospiraceae bacterium]